MLALLLTNNEREVRQLLALGHSTPSRISKRRTQMGFSISQARVEGKLISWESVGVPKNCESYSGTTTIRDWECGDAWTIK